MPFVPFQNVAQVEMVFSLNGQIVENVYHVHDAADWDAAGMNTLAALFESWWKTNMKPYHNALTTLTKIKVKNLETQTGLGIEYGVSSSNVGTDVTAALPNNCTVAVKWTTGLSGRSYRGRTYHLGMAAGFLHATDKNRLAAATLALFVTGYTTLITDVTAATHQLVVCSRRQNHAWLNLGVATIITGVSINDVLDSQRRRLPERGQ